MVRAPWRVGLLVAAGVLLALSGGAAAEAGASPGVEVIVFDSLGEYLEETYEGGVAVGECGLVILHRGIEAVDGRRVPLETPRHPLAARACEAVCGLDGVVVVLYREALSALVVVYRHDLDDASVGSLVDSVLERLGDAGLLEEVERVIFRRALDPALFPTEEEKERFMDVLLSLGGEYYEELGVVYSRGLSAAFSEALSGLPAAMTVDSCWEKTKMSLFTVFYSPAHGVIYSTVSVYNMTIQDAVKVADEARKRLGLCGVPVVFANIGPAKLVITVGCPERNAANTAPGAPGEAAGKGNPSPTLPAGESGPGEALNGAEAHAAPASAQPAQPEPGAPAREPRRPAPPAHTAATVPAALTAGAIAAVAAAARRGRAGA